MAGLWLRDVGTLADTTGSRMVSSGASAAGRCCKGDMIDRQPGSTIIIGFCTPFPRHSVPEGRQPLVLAILLVFVFAAVPQTAADTFTVNNPGET